MEVEGCDRPDANVGVDQRHSRWVIAVAIWKDGKDEPIAGLALETWFPNHARPQSNDGGVEAALL